MKRGIAMSKRRQLISAAFSALLIAAVILMGILTVSAADEPPIDDAPIEPEVVTEAAPDPEPEPESQAESEPEPEPESEYAPESQAEPAEQPDENIVVTPSYEAPEHLDELPSVEGFDIELATAMELPDVEVSDTTLLGGVLMWLCVAVGIAVIAGVLVSRRTKRRGA